MAEAHRAYVWLDGSIAVGSKQKLGNGAGYGRDRFLMIAYCLLLSSLLPSSAVTYPLHALRYPLRLNYRHTLKAVKARNPEAASAAQLTHSGTLQPPITASHPHSSRSACSAATSKKIAPAVNVNVFWLIAPIR